MFRNKKFAITVAAFNEEKLIAKTINALPDFIDEIFVVNDGSTDKTQKVVEKLASDNKKITLLNNEQNRGVGFTVTRGLKAARDKKYDLIAVTAGDAQCDPNYLAKMADTLLDEGWDYVKANRFKNLDALRRMPKHRRIGNIIITIMTKFATGYYSIFDTQNGYGVFTLDVLERLPFELIGERYDYENTMLIALSVIDAQIKDHPVPAIYGDEESTIKLLPTVWRAVKVLFFGFWRRIYYKYIIFDFHPISLFLLSGLVLMLFGFGFGLYIAAVRILSDISPSTGTVMISAIPLLVGFQLFLTAMIMDVNNEVRK